MIRITIQTKSGAVTATRTDEKSLNWSTVYPWGTQPLYGEVDDVAKFIGRRIKERGEAL